MAETLAQAVLEVGVDDSRLRAGLQGVERQAAAAGNEISRRFTASGREILTAANGLEYFIDASGRARRENGRFVTTSELAAAGINKIGQSASTAGLRLQALEQQAKLTANVVNSIFVAGGIVTGAIAAAQSFGGFIQAAVELENITRKLSNTLGDAGAQKALGDLRSLSERLGISFTVLADSFGSFTAAASAAGISLAVQKDLFEAVSTSAQRLGLSNDAINGSLLALQQVAAKGTVQMEELRGQLGERLPTAFAATAQGLGISSRELIKLVESGKLTANEFFPALTKGLTELNGNGNSGVLTAEQNFATFGDRLKDLQAEFGKDFLPGVIATVKQLTELLKEISIQKRSADIGGSFGIGGSLSDQVVGRQIDVERRLGLSKEQSKRIVSDAIAEIDRSAGGTNKTRNAFGQRILTDAEQSRLLDLIGKRAEVFSRPARSAAARNEAKIAEAAAEDARQAALLNTPGKIKERLSTLRKESEGLDFGSSRFKENQAEIAQLEAQTAKGAQKLEDAGKKIRVEIEKGAAKLVEAGKRLQKANENIANAIVSNADIAMEKALAGARRTLEGEIRRDQQSGLIDPQKFVQKFGGSFDSGQRVVVGKGGTIRQQQVRPPSLDLSSLSTQQLQQAAAATGALAGANQALQDAQNENTRATNENNRLLGLVNGRESNLNITVPVGGQKQVYLP